MKSFKASRPYILLALQTANCDQLLFNFFIATSEKKTPEVNGTQNEEKAMEDNGVEEKQPTMQDVVYFIFGMPSMAMIARDSKVQLGFLRNSRSCFLKSKTCFLEVLLPTCHATLEQFSCSFDNGLKIEGKGFMLLQ